LTWDQKFGYDVEYVKRIGLATDLAIVLGTLRVVLLRGGISMDGVATSTRYDDVPCESDESERRDVPRHPEEK
jgi:undecaprenyl phosphate N,N'-diacetylbacillosamine 1-phosphate transferase